MAVTWTALAKMEELVAIAMESAHVRLVLLEMAVSYVGFALVFNMSSRLVDQSALRCPGTLFISHENANFLFSVFRVVQGEAKTPKIMGCCRANFAFLHALKIGTFRGK